MKKILEALKKFAADAKQMRANAQRGIHCAWWGRYIGFQALPYERHEGEKPPVLCGFQLDVGFATVYYGI